MTADFQSKYGFVLADDDDSSEADNDINAANSLFSGGACAAGGELKVEDGQEGKTAGTASALFGSDSNQFAEG